jgi:prepilin-type N-terminal cleavage/methylation domain-containing protein
MKNFKKGFTLIELLVVVAIIGILASVVLASLNSARAKGADAAIKANLANIRAQAELVYDNTTPNGYGTAANASSCSAPTAASLFADTTVLAAMTSATTTAGAAGVCSSSTTSWAAIVPLKATDATFWCVDSTGASKLETALELDGDGSTTTPWACQ